MNRNNYPVLSPRGVLKTIYVVLIALALLNLCGCTPAKLSERSFFAMDTLIEMSIYGDNGEKALKDCEDSIIALEEKLSAQLHGSEIWEINRESGSPITVSEQTASLISQALDVSGKTAGAFDITIYPLMKAWGFIDGDYRVPDSEQISELLKLVGYQRVKAENSTVTLERGMAIDLGGIAKGYACDVLKQELAENGVDSAVMSLGGDVLAYGSKSDASPWRIGISKPDGSADVAGILSVRDTVVVTSGVYQRFFEKEGVSYHHIIDPLTGKPANSGLVSVTVVCKNGALADALSTALLVLGEEKALEYYSTHGGFEAVLITNDARMICTRGLKGKLFDVDNAYTLQYS